MVWITHPHSNSLMGKTQIKMDWMLYNLACGQPMGNTKVLRGIKLVQFGH